MPASASPMLTSTTSPVAPEPTGAGDDVEHRLSPEPVLSAKEIRVIAALANGLNNTEIGHRLGLSPFTVKSHLHRIATKTGCPDRAAIVAHALRRGLID